MRKLTSMFTALLIVSVFIVAFGQQIRPLGSWDHVGLDDRHMPPAEGSNHQGPSTYMNKWMGQSQICENGDNLARPGRGNWFVRALLCND